VPYPGDYAGLLAIAVSTHALIGYVIGSVVFDAPRAGVVGAVAADADLVFSAAWEWPLVHRGPTHSLAAAALAAGLAFAITRDGQITGAVGVGYLSQLLVDATTPTGIPVAWPLSREIFHLPLNGHAGAETVATWAVCLGVLAVQRRETIQRYVGGTDTLLE
jgi:inner membrane protein